MTNKNKKIARKTLSVEAFQAEEPALVVEVAMEIGTRDFCARPQNGNLSHHGPVHPRDEPSHANNTVPKEPASEATDLEFALSSVTSAS